MFDQFTSVMISRTKTRSARSSDLASVFWWVSNRNAPRRVIHSAIPLKWNSSYVRLRVICPPPAALDLAGADYSRHSRLNTSAVVSAVLSGLSLSRARCVSTALEDSAAYSRTPELVSQRQFHSITSDSHFDAAFRSHSA